MMDPRGDARHPQDAAASDVVAQGIHYLFVPLLGGSMIGEQQPRPQGGSI